MKLIDADELRKVMYHEAFETDSDMQKWDGGCWIRYKMFEKAIDFVPTIDAVEVVRCVDCVRWNTIFDRTKAEYGLCQIRSQLEATKNDDFCSKGERRTDA